jgi:hypothetical protein
MTENTSATIEAPPAVPPERTKELQPESLRPATFQRKRGAGFPIVALPEAVTILRQAGRHGNEHSISAFATYLGHSTHNSGSFKRRLAAFRDWKFVLGATGDRVVFTDLGRRVAYPTDPVKEKEDLEEAFQNATLFWKVYDDSAKGVGISLATLANHGVQFGVAPVSKEQFAESLAESAVEAGFAEMEGDKVVFIGAGQNAAVEATPEVGDALYEGLPPPYRGLPQRVPQAQRARPLAPPSRLTFGPTPAQEPVETADDPDELERMTGPVAGRDEIHRFYVPVEEKPAVLHRQSWDIRVGSLVFEIKSSRSLPADAFVQIGKVMSEIEKLKELLTDKADSDSVSEEPAE